MPDSAFTERFLKHLDKIDPAEIESFILRTVRERDFIARIFDTLLAGVVVLDGEFRVSMANTAARRILHWPQRRRVLGEPLLELLDGGSFYDTIQRFQNDPQAIQDSECKVRPGEDRIFSLDVIPIVREDAEATMEGAAIILQDLTAARERQIRSAQAEKIASLATLTSGVAHEIKNPLNSLSIHVQLLEKSIDKISSQNDSGLEPSVSGRIQHHCGVISEEVERLRKCVDDFIDAARPSKPRLQIDNINRILARFVEMARPEAEARGIQLELQLEPDLPTAMLDRGQILAALRNLMRNAIEAIEVAQRPVGEGRIGLRSLLNDERIGLAISDNGCGIPEEEKARIFEPYFTTKFDGSGLGLMAINRIVREHDGEVQLQSTPDVGTTFTLLFPIARRQVRLLDQS